MPKYECKMTLKVSMTMELEADSWSDAHTEAIRIAERCDVRPPDTDEVGVSVTVARDRSATHDKIRQLDEPWCWAEWVDPSTSAHGMHPPSCGIVVVHRAVGNKLSEADVKLLRKRIETMGIRVMDAWNGAGLPSASFRCETSPTAEQLQQLCAPVD